MKAPQKAAEVAAELRRVDSALNKLRTDEMNVIQAQIAGIRSGASPSAYAEVFADIVAERKDIEDRRGGFKTLARTHLVPGSSSDRSAL